MTPCRASFASKTAMFYAEQTKASGINLHYPNSLTNGSTWWWCHSLLPRARCTCKLYLTNGAPLGPAEDWADCKELAKGRAGQWSRGQALAFCSPGAWQGPSARSSSPWPCCAASLSLCLWAGSLAQKLFSLLSRPVLIWVILALLK